MVISFIEREIDWGHHLSSENFRVRVFFFKWFPRDTDVSASTSTTESVAGRRSQVVGVHPPTCSHTVTVQTTSPSSPKAGTIHAYRQGAGHVPFHYMHRPLEDEHTGALYLSASPHYASLAPVRPTNASCWQLPPPAAALAPPRPDVGAGMGAATPAPWVGPLQAHAATCVPSSTCEVRSRLLDATKQVP